MQRAMRRKDREIQDINEKLTLLKKCKVCRLGLCEHKVPYIVPLNFGYSFMHTVLTLYFHSAPEGKKIDMLRANPNACFEIDAEHELVRHENACNYSFRYASLIGSGTVSFIDDPEEKRHALNALMQHQTGEAKSFDFKDEEIACVLVFKLTVSEFSGKRR